MQTTVENSMTKGLVGQITDLANATIETYLNNSKQLDLITMPAGQVVSGTVHTITINGNSYSYTETGGQSAAQIAAGIIVIINAGSEPITITDNSDGTFDIMGNVAGTAFTISVSANITITNLITNQQAIPFGRMVVQDNETGMDNKCHLPSTSTMVTGRRGLGFSVHDHAHEQAISNADNEGYPFQDSISVLRKGKIYVQVEEAVTPASIPHVRYASGTYDDLGAVRASIDGGTAAPLSIARFKDSASALGIATLEINWP